MTQSIHSIIAALMPVVSAIFWGVLVLSVLVFAHEAGHYAAARSLKVRVTEFFLGMPCRVKLSRRSKTHGTEFGATPLLLGGYTKICGMATPENPELKRVFAAFCERGTATCDDLTAELGISEADYYECAATLVDWAALEPVYPAADKPVHQQESWPERFQLPVHDAAGHTIYDSAFDSATAVAAGTPLVAAGESDAAESAFAIQKRGSYSGQGFWGRTWMLIAGPLASLATGLICFVLALSVLGIPSVKNVSQVGSVEADSLAEAAGLAEGDTIVAVGNTQTTSFEELAAACKAALAAGERFSITLERDGQTKQVEIDPSGQDALGIGAPLETVRLSPVEAATFGVSYCLQAASFVVRLIIPTHTAEVVSQSSSVMGISVMAAQAAALGAANLIMFAGAISISLGFMNLLPIPPLDGGKILIEIIQALIGRQLSSRAQNYLSYAGFALFILLFLVVLKNDVVRFVFGLS